MMGADNHALSSLTSSSSSIRASYSQNPNPTPNPAKRKRNLPGNPDPDAEVIAMSPKSLMATNRFVCEICNKGFQRDQNLQLHRRGHNLPWKLKQRSSKEVVRKKVYICPEKSCVHHHPSRALGDLTGIKKHFSRKHGEKKWKCDKCSKKYAVHSDWKAHNKICGTREYKCDCGTLFSRKDSFITHRAFCDALAEESSRFTSLRSPNQTCRQDLFNSSAAGGGLFSSALQHYQFGSHFSRMPPPCHDLMGGGSGGCFDSASQLTLDGQKPRYPLWPDSAAAYSHDAQHHMTLPQEMFVWSGGNPTSPSNASTLPPDPREEDPMRGGMTTTSLFYNQSREAPPPVTGLYTSATALLQKAAQMGSRRSKESAALFGMNEFGLTCPATMSAGSSINGCFNDIAGSTAGKALHQDHQNIFGNSRMAVNGEGNNNNNSNGLWMMIQNKGNQHDQIVDLSLTRDFLGVGGIHESKHLFGQNDLAELSFC
ncbi:unnamed protein product [Cuscuta epithymum]|uniref:C2H2-type domain-containing protein n=1 Tax=Cuscuta epithymum TaxID=186058 RepID=A0AAV0F447_9ASTE|nr:unnamed protein product [Cuscuta epithymum]